MKRLVISLLRLGDIMMMAPALQSLKLRYPDDELHLMINEDFSHIRNLLPFVDQMHFFPRGMLQEQLANPEAPILAAFDQLEEYIENLNRVGFDEVINLTHNRLSGYLTSLIHAEFSSGLKMQASGEFEIHGKWFEILNQPANEMPYHFSEVFLRSVGDSGYLKPKFGNSPKIIGNKGKALLIQPFSNEVKKMWGMKQWSQLLEDIHRSGRFKKIGILAAPFESQKVDSFIHQLQLPDLCIIPLICDLDGALTHIYNSDLLITVDTSIKHLAASTEIGIVELALGSSYPEHTGAFRDNVFVISSDTHCYPCEHSRVCSQKKHFCGMDLDAKFIAKAILKYNDGSFDALKTLIESSPNSNKFYKSHITESGSWSLVPLHDVDRDKNLNELLGKYINSSFLEDNQGEVLGSSAWSVSEIVKARFCRAKWLEIAADVLALENSCEKKLQLLTSAQVQLRSLLGRDYCQEEYEKIIDQLFQISGIDIDRSRAPVRQKNVVDYQILSTISSLIKEQKEKNEYSHRFLRTIKLQLMESSK